MDYKIIKNEILTINLKSSDMTEGRTCLLHEKLLQSPLKKIGFDFSKIESFETAFFEKLCLLSKKKDIAIYNMSIQNIALFFLFKCNKFISLFLNEQDFIANKNPMIKREFFICN